MERNFYRRTSPIGSVVNSKNHSICFFLLYRIASGIKNTNPSGGGGGVTPIRGMVYMCLPGLWVNLRYFSRVMGHVL